jgi:hypothetical protein
MSIKGDAIPASVLLSIGEVARLAEVPRDAVNNALRFGRLRYMRHDSRRMIRRADAEAWARTIRIVRVPSHWERRAVNGE